LYRLLLNGRVGKKKHCFPGAKDKDCRAKNWGEGVSVEWATRGLFPIGLIKGRAMDEPSDSIYCDENYLLR